MPTRMYLYVSNSLRISFSYSVFTYVFISAPHFNPVEFLCFLPGLQTQPPRPSLTPSDLRFCLTDILTASPRAIVLPIAE